MGFFNNIGATPPTKDNIYSLFVIPNADGHSWGKPYARKSSAGLRIVIDNEIRSNTKGVRYVSQGKDYDTEKIVRGLTEEHLCVEDIQEIGLYFTIKLNSYPYEYYGLDSTSLSRIYMPDEVLAEVVLKNNALFRFCLRPIEM